MGQRRGHGRRNSWTACLFWYFFIVGGAGLVLLLLASAQYPGQDVVSPIAQDLVAPTIRGDAIAQVRSEKDTAGATGFECTVERSTVRVHVMVVPSQFGAAHHASRVKAILETWGRNASYSLPDGGCLLWEVRLANEGSAYENPKQLQPLPGENVPPPGIQKLGKSPALLFNILHEFSRAPEPDWVLKVDDCVLVVPENFIALLSRYDSERSWLLGSHLKMKTRQNGQLFVSSAGFALSRGALRLLKGVWEAAESYQRDRPDGAPPRAVVVWMRSNFLSGTYSRMPDVGLSALCLRLGVEVPSTRDDSGGERFNAFPLAPSAMNGYHDWYVNYKKIAEQTPQRGPACCASDSVLFHYMGGADILFLDEVLRDKSYDALPIEKRLERWPKVGTSLFDAWDKRARPNLDANHSVWLLIDKLRRHLLELRIAHRAPERLLLKS